MKKLFIILMTVMSVIGSIAQSAYTPTAENLQARKWFDSARFGMFIHWGASSLLGNGEWVMNNRNIRVQEYQRLLHIFNPIDFNAEKWVSNAKRASMQYITLITRHHDGLKM